MKRIVLALVAAAAIALPASFALQARAQSDDNAQIEALYQQFTTAFRNRDLDAVMSVYEPGPNLFVFDVGPPREHVGWDSYRADWKTLFASFKSKPKTTIQELSITIDGDIAYTHFVQPVTVKIAGSGKSTIVARVTDVLRKINGKWLIVQEHVSVPVDLNSGKADMMSRP